MSYKQRYFYNNTNFIKFSIKEYPKSFDTTVSINISSNNSDSDYITLDLYQTIDYFKQIVKDLESYKASSQTTKKI